MSYRTAMLIQSIIIKLTQPMIKATKMLMFQCHKIIVRLDKTSASSDICICPARSYPHTVLPFPIPLVQELLLLVHAVLGPPCTSFQEDQSLPPYCHFFLCSPSLTWIPIDEDNSGYFASPDGATESCDYDKDRVHCRW